MPDYEITVRTAITDFPVPVMRPANTDADVIALDIAPKGSPSPFGSHGYAWIDVCDKDIAAIDAGTLPAENLNCARLGINETAVWVGSVSFYGATPKPVELVVGGVPKVRFNETFIQFLKRFNVGTDHYCPGFGNTNTGSCINEAGTGYFSASGAVAAVFNRNEAGGVMQLRLAGALVGTISVSSTGVTLSGFKQIDDLLARVAALEAAL